MSKKIDNRPEIRIPTMTEAGLKALFGKGKFATVKFIKKSTDTLRTLNGKLTVQSAFAGGDASYDASARGQVRIVDVNIHKDRKGNKIPRTAEFRAVTLANIKEVTADGVRYIVEGGEPVLDFLQNPRYNERFQILALTLNGEVYAYKHVPKYVYRNLVLSENKGKYFNEFIKGVYEFSKVPDTESILGNTIG